MPTSIKDVVNSFAIDLQPRQPDRMDMVVREYRTESDIRGGGRLELTLSASVPEDGLGSFFEFANQLQSCVFVSVIIPCAAHRHAVVTVEEKPDKVHGTVPVKCDDCGLEDVHNVAGGVYCANPLCPGLGAADFRRKHQRTLYDRESGFSTLFDESSYFVEGMKLARRRGQSVWEAAKRCFDKWLEE